MLSPKKGGHFMAESDDEVKRKQQQEIERQIREHEKQIREQEERNKAIIREQEEERKKAIRDTFKPPKPKPDDEDD
jgi:hypothetical protein